MPKTPEELEAERLAAEALAEVARKAQEENKEADPEPEELTAEKALLKLAETEKKLRAANKESAERRFKLEALEAEEAKRKEAELTETQKLEARAQSAEAEKDRLEQENRELRLRGQFDQKIRSMKLAFANDTASGDAFRALDLEGIGDDLSGLEPAIKALLSERPYLFIKSETQRIDDGSAKGRSSAHTLTREAVDKKRSGVSPL